MPEYSYISIITVYILFIVYDCMAKRTWIKRCTSRLHVSSLLAPLIRSDEGLMFKTSAFESLYHGQFTLSTQLIKTNYM